MTNTESQSGLNAPTWAVIRNSDILMADITYFEAEARMKELYLQTGSSGYCIITAESARRLFSQGNGAK